MIVTKEILITGMQCSGCETIIEETIDQIDGVLFAKADYLKSAAKVRFDADKTNMVHIQEACAAKGYALESTGNDEKLTISKIIFSILAMAALVVAVMLARKFGQQLKVPEINSHTSNGLIFTVGLLTGLHCVGMCGSFLIGYTVNDSAQSRSVFRSHLQYGAGKTLSYAMFGALFGFLGSLFRITPFIGGLSIGLAGIFMILFGLNMLNFFQAFKAFRISQPVLIMHFVSEKRRQLRSPFFIGIFSGFIIGCGPLQVMYVLAAGNGNALEGAKILTWFGLGTLPALLGFGLLARILSNTMTRRFIQLSGIILIVLGSMMFIKGLMRTTSGNDLKTVHPCCQEQVDKK